MRRKLLLFVVLLTGLTGVWAADAGAIVSISNIKNVVRGYSGSFDIVLNENCSTYWVTLGLDVQLPAGFTYTGYTPGGLLTESHASNISTSDQGNNTHRFGSYANPTANFTATQGVLLTIHFDVADNAESGYAYVKDASFTLGTTSYYATETSALLAVGNTVTLSEDETEAPAAISNVNVTVERTLKGGMWNTLVLPFDISSSQIAAVFGTGTEVASFSGADVTRTDGKTTGIKVNFTSLVGDMKAHTPYIIKVPSDLAQFTVESAAITTSSDPSINKGDEEEYFKFVGTYTTNMDIPDGGLYLMNNKFKYSSGSSKLKAFRGYFNFWRKLYGYKTASAPAITLDVDGISTGISSATLDDKAGMPNEKYYTVQGLQVSQPKRGLYIVNGKKMIVK